MQIRPNLFKQFVAKATFIGANHMNKRFTLKIFKYIFIFLTITLIIMSIGIVLFFTNITKLVYLDLNEVDEFYTDLAISKKGHTYDTEDNFKRMLKEKNAKLYITDNRGNTKYPSKHKNIKKLIVNNINNTKAIPFRNKNTNVIIIYPKKENIKLKNTNEINTKKLIKSLYINNLNPYQHHIVDGKLKYTKNPAARKIIYGQDDDLSTVEKKTLIFIFVVILLLFLLNFLFVIIFAIIISKRLTKPLFFYTDWIANLSAGKLFKPSSKHYNKRSKKLFKELNDSVETLNTQLTQNRIYQNQINYYREKWLNQISHDLKSPLTSIYGYARLLSIQTEDVHKHSELIADKASYMSKLISSLNENFKNETDQMKLHKEKFNVTKTFDELIRSIQYDKFKLNNHLHDDEFYGNKLYFQRMLMNLIDNSIDHNKFNPFIEVTLENDGDFLLIDYKDDGIGLKEDIFDQLFNSKYTTKENKQNHGLGTMIIKEVIDYHNGKFKILPTEKGVHFKIYLKHDH